MKPTKPTKRTTPEQPVEADDGAVGRRRWDPNAVGTALVLAAWSGVLWFLWIGGGWALHVSPRIFWVVPFGAIVLAIGAVGRLVTARTGRAQPLEARRVWPLVVLTIPVVVILAMPSSALGTYAASHRGVYSGTTSLTANGSLQGPVTQVEVASAPFDADVLKALVQRAGERVTFVGFVSHEADTLSDEFLLNRFVVTCCVADALDALMRVVNVTGGPYKSGQWVSVTGVIYPMKTQVILDARSVTAIDRPKHPYLTP
jgi:uncharacterized repeat protein (TIGR03943 family)